MLFLITVFLMGLLAGNYSPAYAAYESIELLGFVITFEGVDYDPATNKSIWTYRIQGNYTGPHDLSHWILALCRGDEVQHTVVQNRGRYEASHDNVEVFTRRGDPIHGINGIKFDVEVNKNGGDTVFWFVLEGNWEPGPVDIGVKAGPVSAVDKILGPSCSPAMCEIAYSVSHNRLDFRIMRPGVYAAPLAVIELSGTGGAKLTFEDFSHGQYLTDPGALPVLFEYSVGATLEEADAFGWRSADDMNGERWEYDQAEVQAGKTITLWVKATVTDYHFSSDYEAAGKISITPVCL